MFTTYAIRSVERNYVYIGLSNNLHRRLEQHNKGYNKTTKPYRPFELIYTDQFESRIMARQHENFLKTSKGRDFLKTLMSRSSPKGKHLAGNFFKVKILK